MSQVIILGTKRAAEEAVRVVLAAPPGSVLEVKAPRRTNDQNSRLWAMLSDVARAKPEGRSLPPEIWKTLFMSAAGFMFKWEPGLDGEGVVPVGFKSSRLSKAEFGELIECVQEYGARHGVEWTEPEREAA
jgi:NinB protein